jgi:hypothetical protein
MKSELLIFLLFSSAYCGVYTGYYCDPIACQPPACLCPSTNPPGNLSRDDTPQFILLTLDDGVGDYYQSFVDKILKAHNNSNGCPIPATYFTSIQYTDFYQLQKLYSRGMEIATHTMFHIGDPPEYEVVGAKEAINGW